MTPRSAQIRRETIVELATSSGATNVGELAERFGVTQSTIRRDLAQLSEDGKITRTFGGAIGLFTPREASLRQRIGDGYAAKRAIGKWARTLVNAGDSVLLDAGSSVGALAHELRHAERIHVVTMSLKVIDELAEARNIVLECLGGRLRSMSEAFVGPLTESALERMTFDSAFLGTDGVDAVRGICEADLEQTRLKEIMSDRADRVYVLAHSAKVGATPFHAWAKLEEPWTLVTDAGISSEQLLPFLGTGVEIIVIGDDGEVIFTQK